MSDDPRNTIIVITDKDVPVVNGRRSLNSFIDTITKKSNELLLEIQEWEEQHTLRRLGQVKAAIIMSLTMLASSLIMTAPHMSDTVPSYMVSKAGPKYRSVKLIVKTNKWAALSFMIGVKKVSVMLPPCDVDVNLSTEFWNEGDRFTSILVGYAALCTSDSLLDLQQLIKEMGVEAFKASAITNEVESTFEANIYISHQEHEFLPKVLLSKSSTQLFDATQAA